MGISLVSLYTSVLLLHLVCFFFYNHENDSFTSMFRLFREENLLKRLVDPIGSPAGSVIHLDL